MTKSIRLYNVYTGPGLASGTDKQGDNWTEFSVDYGALEEDGACAICGAALSSGWTSEHGTEVCAAHIDTSPVHVDELDEFTLAYVECALWSSTDDDERPLDDNYGPDDIHPETLARMALDCALWQAAHADDLGDNPARAGQDYWLSRNGHGSGYFDGNYHKAGDLQRAARADGTVDLYVGDDGLVHAN